MGANPTKRTFNRLSWIPGEAASSDFSLVRDRPFETNEEPLAARIELRKKET
jgi:hypothetical protein